MFVIKGRQIKYASSPMPPLYAELKKFANVKDTSTFQLQITT
jgi:hypothetical protein